MSNSKGEQTKQTIPVCLNEDGCSRCGKPFARYNSKEVEKRHSIDGKALGLDFGKGVLACPSCYKLKKGEYWMKEDPNIKSS